MRFKRWVAGIVTVTMTVATFGVASPSMAGADGANADIVAALAGVTGNRVAQAAPSVADYDSAAQTGTVDIPRDPTKGVRLTTDGQVTTIDLPDAGELSQGVRMPNGAVLYRNPNGSAHVVVPTPQGDVQFLIVIERPDAPEEYTYPIGSPGSTVHVGTRGNALVLGTQGQPTNLVQAPWAQDAGGAPVSTHFTGGTVLTQRIAHRAESVEYPVAADPHFQRYSSGVVVTLTEFETGALAASLIFLPVVSGLVSIGGLALSNKVLWRVGWYQAQAAWYAVHDQCLWIWVPYIGPPESGGYPC